MTLVLRELKKCYIIGNRMINHQFFIIMDDLKLFGKRESLVESLLNCAYND